MKKGSPKVPKYLGKMAGSSVTNHDFRLILSIEQFRLKRCNQSFTHRHIFDSERTGMTQSYLLSSRMRTHLVRVFSRPVFL